MIQIQLFVLRPDGLRHLNKTMKIHGLSLTGVLRYCKVRATHEKADHILSVLMDGELVAEYGGIL